MFCGRICLTDAICDFQNKVNRIVEEKMAKEESLNAEQKGKTK